MRQRRVIATAAVTVLSLSMLAPAVATAMSTAAPLERVTWRQLTFKARKLLMSATTTITVEVEDRTAVQPALRPPPGTTTPAVPPAVARITTASELPLGRGELATAWIDPGTGATLQAEKLVSGSHQYWKLRRYTAGGLFAWRSEPASKREATAPRSGWSNCEEKFQEWPSPVPSGRVVTDSYALLYLISAARLDQEGRQLRVLVFSDERLVEVTFTAGETALLQTTYQERWDGGSRERLGPVPVRVVRTAARALDQKPGAEPVDLDFMGIKGELTVSVELGTGVPVELEGRADVVGNIRVKLQEAVLADARSAQRRR